MDQITRRPAADCRRRFTPGLGCIVSGQGGRTLLLLAGGVTALVHAMLLGKPPVEKAEGEGVAL